MAIDRSLITPAALEVWPTASTAHLAPEAREQFRQQRKSIELLAKGMLVAEIEQRTGVRRSQLYNLVRRALKIHPDGQVFGFRALLPYHRVKSHERSAPLRHRPQSTAGSSGAMSQLIARYPELEVFLQAEIARHPLLFAEGRAGSVRVQGLKPIHARFLDRCRELGLRESDYPMVKDQQGIRALSKVIKRFKGTRFHEAAKAAGASHSKRRWCDDESYSAAPLTRPYEAVEFDGHKLDLRVSVSFADPFGFEQTLELTRVWILAIVDVVSRTILGYALVLAPEYNRYDVIRAIQKAIEPHPPYPFSIPLLGYGPLGGFPSQRLPELTYAVWDEFRFDNAKANLAADTLAVLREELGCVAHAGPVAQPDHRAIIERFFKTLTSTLSQRMPATTRSSPEELRRQLNAADSPAQLTMPLAELEELIEAVVGALNGTPHSSLGGRTPLQALEYFIRGKHTPVRHLPEPMRRNLCLLQMAHASRVAGNIAKGVRPTVNFFGVRYSSAAFSECTDLIGQPIMVYYNPDNIRTIRVFGRDGGEIGLLTAARPWNQVVHSLRMRQRINKLIRDAKIRVPANSNPVEIYLKYIEQQAPKSRRLASELEVAQRSAQTPAVTAPNAPGPTYAECDPLAVVTAAPPAESKPPKPVKPRRLKIPSGFNY